MASAQRKTSTTQFYRTYNRSVLTPGYAAALHKFLPTAVPWVLTFLRFCMPFSYCFVAAAVHDTAKCAGAFRSDLPAPLGAVFFVLHFLSVGGGAFSSGSISAKEMLCWLTCR